MNPASFHESYFLPDAGFLATEILSALHRIMGRYYVWMIRFRFVSVLAGFKYIYRRELFKYLPVPYITLILTIMVLADCRIQLKEDPGPTEINIEGLWIQESCCEAPLTLIDFFPLFEDSDENRNRVGFRILKRTERNLAFSGRRNYLAFREGYGQTSKNSVLLHQEYFSFSYRQIADKWNPDIAEVRERSVTGSSRHELINIENNMLIYENQSYVRILEPNIAAGGPEGVIIIHEASPEVEAGQFLFLTLHKHLCRRGNEIEVVFAGQGYRGKVVNSGAGSSYSVGEECLAEWMVDVPDVLKMAGEGKGPDEISGILYEPDFLERPFLPVLAVEGRSLYDYPGDSIQRGSEQSRPSDDGVESESAAERRELLERLEAGEDVSRDEIIRILGE